jgi:hypothetical protein
MEDTSYVAIVIGILVPTVVFLCVVLVVCIRRLRGQSANPGYAQVQHQLDEEEIEFKRFIESQHSGGGGDEDWGAGMDDIDAFFEQSLSLDDTTHDSIDAEALQFDEEERNHLSILEKFRAQLITSTQEGEEKPPTANPRGGIDQLEETRL